MDFQLSKFLIHILTHSFPIFGTGHFNAKLRTFLYDPFCLEIISFSHLRTVKGKSGNNYLFPLNWVLCFSFFLFFFFFHLMLIYVIWKLTEMATQKCSVLLSLLYFNPLMFNFLWTVTSFQSLTDARAHSQKASLGGQTLRWVWGINPHPPFKAFRENFGACNFLPASPSLSQYVSTACNQTQ